MKRKPIYLLLLLLILVPALVFLCDKMIVPNDAIGQKKNFDAWLVKHKDRIHSLLYEYREYSAECYADSQHIETHPVITNKEGAVLPVYIISWVWIHRTPTLPGFMQFLEEKYK